MPIQHTSQSTNLLEVLERILDKGVVIAGDIKIAIADVDLLTIKIRLLVASVDKAREIGMDWWERDSYYSSKAKLAEKEHAQLLERINRLEHLVETKALPQEILGKELMYAPRELDMGEREQHVEEHDSFQHGDADVPPERAKEKSPQANNFIPEIHGHEIKFVKKPGEKKPPGKQ